MEGVTIVRVGTEIYGTKDSVDSGLLYLSSRCLVPAVYLMSLFTKSPETERTLVIPRRLLR
jgi:hypothetical protein